MTIQQHFLDCLTTTQKEGIIIELIPDLVSLVLSDRKSLSRLEKVIESTYSLKDKPSKPILSSLKVYFDKVSMLYHSTSKDKWLDVDKLYEQHKPEERRVKSGFDKAYILGAKISYLCNVAGRISNICSFIQKIIKKDAIDKEISKSFVAKGITETLNKLSYTCSLMLTVKIFKKLSSLYKQTDEETKDKLHKLVKNGFLQLHQRISVQHWLDKQWRPYTTKSPITDTIHKLKAKDVIVKAIEYSPFVIEDMKLSSSKPKF
jgi:hypothetical protein